jgi:hypothetical protein
MIGMMGAMLAVGAPPLVEEFAITSRPPPCSAI